MLKVLLTPLALIFILVMLAAYPWATIGALVLVFIIAMFMHKPSHAPAPEAVETPRTADGRFPLLNEDWVDETVLSIDDPQIPPIIRRHGARFRNPARYAIDLGNGEYLLYGGDGELLDLCCLE